MTYEYIRSEPSLWTVGVRNPDGSWEPESDHGSPAEAAERVAWLNGGAQGADPTKLAAVTRHRDHLQQMLAKARKEAAGRKEHGIRLKAEVKRLTAETKEWHDTYQQHAASVDAFLAKLLAMLPGAADTGSDVYDQIPRGIEALQAEVKQLREQLEVTRRVGEAETARAAYEAMDTERRGWESRRAVENVTLAELRAERNRFRDLTDRAYDLHMYGENAPGGTDTWTRWDRDAEAALRAAMEDGR